MTVQQSTAIRAVLAAAPVEALRRVVRQPLRLWKAGGMTRGNPCRCLVHTLERWGKDGTNPAVVLSLDIVTPAFRAFDAACATDGLPATVAACKRLARGILAERGEG